MQCIIVLAKIVNSPSTFLLLNDQIFVNENKWNSISYFYLLNNSWECADKISKTDFCTNNVFMSVQFL
jgi:hypothetical protein